MLDILVYTSVIEQHLCFWAVPSHFYALLAGESRTPV
jgi:hypothetical protein